MLRTPAYEQWRDRPDAMKRGVLVLLVCFLMAGSVASAIGFVNNVRPVSLEDADQFRNEFQRNMEQWQQFMPQQDPFMQMFMDAVPGQLRVGLPHRRGHRQPGHPPAARPGPRLCRRLGGWLSGALGQMGAWLAYAIWVLLFAKLLGGNGGVDRFLGLTALFAIPNLLSIFSPIPCVGPFIAFIGWLWGVAVYVKAVQVSQRLDTGKAILAAVPARADRGDDRDDRGASSACWRSSLRRARARLPEMTFLRKKCHFWEGDRARRKTPPPPPAGHAPW